MKKEAKCSTFQVLDILLLQPKIVLTSFFFLGLLPPSSSSSELLFFELLESLERPEAAVFDLLAPLLGVEVPPLLFL